MTTTVEDYAYQANIKFGPHDQHLLNIRGKNAGEFGERLDSVAGFTDLLKAVAADVQAVATVGAAVPGTEQVHTPAASYPASAPQAAPAANGPACAHGPMKYVAKSDWSGWFCPLPKERPDRCKPVWNK